MVKLKPMDEAPKDAEILAYHKDGKTLHPVKWNYTAERWGMRWHTGYSQHSTDFLGWVSMPEVM